MSVGQLNAIDILVQGKTDQETALAVGVTRETVTRWRNDNPHFAAELNKQRRSIWAASHDRLRSLAGKAVDTLEAALDSGDSRIAVEVMKAVGLYGQVKPPGGPADAELVMWEKAKEWALAESPSRSISISDQASLGKPSTNAVTKRAGWSWASSSSRAGGSNQACSRLTGRSGIFILPTPRCHSF